MKTERFALIITSAALLSLGALRWYGVTGNISDSEPPGLYLTIPGLPTRGSMVALRPLMKHVAGLPGDTVTVTPQGSLINGHLWPNSAPATTPYQPYPFGVYRLGPYQYWLMGTSPMSWDSRYEGPFPADLLATRIKPLLTGDPMPSKPYPPPPPPQSPILTLPEVATLLKVHPSTVYRLVKKKQIPCFRVGSDWRFNRESIEKFMQQTTQAPEEKH